MKIILSFLALTFSLQTIAQKEMPYHPEADAKSEIKIAVKKAKKENKFVLIQAGGNWCSWCLEFARFAKADAEIDSLINADFVWYHLNYSKENKNLQLFEKYGFAQRFGFPVFIVLDQKGNRIHTQNSEYLEDGKKSYDKKKVLSFLNAWSPAALDAGKYRN
jgi:thioredoxin-related protein